jgi:2-keto-3-deoxy-L-rhamnonate aldolase RhmA
VGIFASDVSMAVEYIEKGFSLIALSMDAFFLWQAAQAALEEVRGQTGTGGA